MLAQIIQRLRRVSDDCKMKFDSNKVADEVKSKYGSAMKTLLTLITRQTAG